MSNLLSTMQFCSSLHDRLRRQYGHTKKEQITSGDDQERFNVFVRGGITVNKCIELILEQGINQL